MIKKAVWVSLALALTIGLWGGFLLPCFSQGTDTLTITTYYPSPFGVYSELRAKKMVIGGTWYSPATHPATDSNLDVEGNIYAQGTICAGSSRAFKEGIHPFKRTDYQSLIDKLKGVNIVHYKFKGRKDTHIGVIAEDAPSEIVNSAKNRINISDYLGFLLAVVKAQQEEIENLKGLINIE